MSGGPDAGAYPGNPSLPREVRDKILSTFRHTLNLYKENKTDDCLIGCDFILKMDPRFGPARQLMEKAKNPASEVDVARLEAIVAETPTRQERVSSPETDRLLVRAAESFNARDFDAAIATAEQVLQVLPGNQDATQILEKARQKKNAQPQFEVARQRAIAALDGQRPTEARAALDKMRSLDPEHPAVALLDRRLAAPAPAATEVGESTNPGLSLADEPPPVAPPPRPGPPPSRPAPPPPPPPAPVAEDMGGGLGDLSLDAFEDSSTALVPPPDMGGNPATGPLALSGNDFSDRFSGAAGGAPNLWSEPPADQGGLGDLSLDASPEPSYAADSAFSSAPEPAFTPAPAAMAPEPPSQQQEIESLLDRGDDAARSGNRQQAIEIWSRIFLIDINNSEAVGRIEKARKEMSEGNKRVAEGLKRGREAFESGDFTGAREAFLEVLALDESDATARSYLDRIESELARPSSGLDLARKAPESDILAEEMADAAEPELETPAPVSEAKPKKQPRARAPMDRKFLMALGAALVLAIAVGGYFFLRPGRSGAPAPGTADGGPSLEHATALFRDGKLDETIAELKSISPQHPDYARAQKMLATLSRKGSGGESAATSDAAPGASAAAPAVGPPPEAVRQREQAEKALSEKRYIDALTAFNLAAPAYHDDPTFSQSLGAASEKVSELTPAVKLFNEAEYETAIPILWRIYQAERDNQDARSYLLRSYFNQGVAQLQNGLYPKAVESFKEVLAIDPADADAIRHKKFAEHYLKGDLDLMGRIYVRHVQQRP
ncbi:MAG TPA: tetratricopeptide repeat protein [Thermoanaerobaculia bacterium]|nr:tetratricopeptide repeat protein [Thermoanaerobaculia bacterium]